MNMTIKMLAMKEKNHKLLGINMTGHIKSCACHTASGFRMELCNERGICGAASGGKTYVTAVVGRLHSSLSCSMPRFLRWSATIP